MDPSPTLPSVLVILEEIPRKVFNVHFGQLSVIFLQLSATMPEWPPMGAMDERGRGLSSQSSHIKSVVTNPGASLLGGRCGLSAPFSLSFAAMPPWPQLQMEEVDAAGNRAPPIGGVTQVRGPANDDGSPHKHRVPVLPVARGRASTGGDRFYRPRALMPHGHRGNACNDVCLCYKRRRYLLPHVIAHATVGAR